MKSKIVILDNGHGAMIGGQYQTAGKRSPKWEKGILYEGAFNRWIVNGVTRILDLENIPYFHVSPELNDISLRTRVNRANKIFKEIPNSYLLSIHANAGGGTGFEGFTSHGETQSDAIAEVFLSNFAKQFPKIKSRFDHSDGDKDKEASYFVLKKTNCPAFLFECGFMDHRRDYKLLFSKTHQDAISENLAESIIQLYKGK